MVPRPGPGAWPPVEQDRNGNLFAWWGGEPWVPGAVLTGSHFDSVPHGGGYDGPLGIVSAFLAIDRPMPTPPPWWIDTHEAPDAVLTSALSSGQSAMASEPSAMPSVSR